MGAIMDLLFSENWEQFQRVRLYKKLGKKLESLPPDKLQKIKEILEEE